MIDTPVASIDRPAELEGRDTACAVYVSDDLNAPVIRAGDIAYVDPSRPLLVGRMVRAFPRGEAAYFAVLVARTDTTVKLQTATEPSPRAFARSDILRLERVTGWLQLEV